MTEAQFNMALNMNFQNKLEQERVMYNNSTFVNDGDTKDIYSALEKYWATYPDHITQDEGESVGLIPKSILDAYFQRIFEKRNIN